MTPRGILELNCGNCANVTETFCSFLESLGYKMSVFLTHLLGVLVARVATELLGGKMFQPHGSLPVQRARPRRPELTAPMPRLELLADQLWREAAALVVLALPVGPGRGRQSGRVGGEGPQSSLVVVCHCCVLVPVAVPAGWTRGALRVAAPGLVHVAGVWHHLLGTVGFVETGAGLMLGVVVEAVWLPRGRLGRIAAPWRRLVLHRGVAQQLPAWWAVVGSEGMLRVTVLGTGSAGVVQPRRGSSRQRLWESYGVFC